MGGQGQPADFGDLGKENEEKGWFERAQQTIGVSSVSFSGHAEAFLDQLTLQVRCPVGEGVGGRGGTVRDLTAWVNLCAATRHAAHGIPTLPAKMQAGSNDGISRSLRG